MSELVCHMWIRAENTRAYIGHVQQQRSSGENGRQQTENIEFEKTKNDDGAPQLRRYLHR